MQTVWVNLLFCVFLFSHCVGYVCNFSSLFYGDIPARIINKSEYFMGRLAVATRISTGTYMTSPDQYRRGIDKVASRHLSSCHGKIKCWEVGDLTYA